MDLKKKIAMLALSAGFLFGSAKAASTLDLEVYLDLLPEPFNRTAMVDPDLPNTKLKISESLDTKLDESPRYKLPSLDLAESLRVFTFNVLDEKDQSKKAFGLTLMTTGLVQFSKDPKELEGLEDTYYKLMAELFIEWPKITNNIDYGPRAFFVGGFVREGFFKLDFDNFENNITNVENIEDLAYTAGSIVKSKNNYNSFFTDLYIITNSDWSDQFLIGRFGLNNLFHPMEKPNFHSSLTMEFPSLIPNHEAIKIAPYFSLYAEIPTSNFNDIRTLIEAGIKIFGDHPNTAVNIFAYLDHKPKREKPADIFYGVKLNPF